MSNCASVRTAVRKLKGLGALVSLILASAITLPAQAQTLSTANRLHGYALDSFRKGRFPEAYGRFVSLADAGHPASAQYALWMCEHGPQLFGKEWDCSREQLMDWAQLAGTTVSPFMARRYGLTMPVTGRSMVANGASAGSGIVARPEAVRARTGRPGP